MWFIGVEVEQETSAPSPKKKILDRPLPWYAEDNQGDHWVDELAFYIKIHWFGQNYTVRLY